MMSRNARAMLCVWLAMCTVGWVAATGDVAVPDELFEDVGDAELSLTVVAMAERFKDHGDELRTALAEGADASERDDHLNTALHVAAASGNTDLLALLFEHNAELDALNEQGDSPLFMATRYMRPEAMAMLLNAGADVNAAGGPKRTPLYAAARTGQIAAVQTLLDKGAELGLALHGGAVRGQEEVVDALLAVDGVDVNVLDESMGPYATALYIAARQELPHIVQKLLDAGADMGHALIGAATPGNAPIIEMLLDAGADVNEPEPNQGWTALYASSRNGKIDAVELLLARGATLGFALHGAAVRGQVEIADLLLDAHADLDAVDGEGKTALFHAAAEGHAEMVRKLVTAGADPNVAESGGEGFTPLLVAFVSGQEEVVRAMLAAPGLDVAKPDNEGFAPMHAAAFKGYVGILHELGDMGADVDVQDNMHESTPLHTAAHNGHLDAVRALLAMDADATVQEKEHAWTALHAASYQGHADIVRLLAAKHASARDDEGNLPIHVAAEGGREDVVHALVAVYGLVDSGVLAKNNDGKLPHEVAADKGEVDLSKLLQRMHHDAAEMAHDASFNVPEPLHTEL